MKPARPQHEQDSFPLAAYGLIVLIVIMIGRIQEILPFLWTLHLAKISLVATVVLFFFDSSRSKTMPPFSSHIRILYWLFGMGLFSTLFSYWPSSSLEFMLTNVFSVLIFTTLMVKIVVNWQTLYGIVWGVVLTVTVLAGGTLLLYNEGGRAQLEGTAYDPNDLAAVLVIFLPLVYFLAKDMRGWRRLGLFGVMALSLLTIMATQSRGGFIGLVVVFVAILIRERVSLFNMLLILLVAATLFFSLAPPAYRERLVSLLNPSQDYNLTAHSGRIAVWKRGLAIMFQHPLTGVGPAVFTVAEGNFHARTGGKWSDSHNSFVQIGAELGLVGLALFLRLLYLCIGSLRRFHQSPGVSARQANLASGMELGFYGYVVTGSFLSMGYSAILFLLVGMSAVVSGLTAQPAVRPLWTGVSR